jgi:hypothetical protein
MSNINKLEHTEEEVRGLISGYEALLTKAVNTSDIFEVREHLYELMKALADSCKWLAYCHKLVLNEKMKQTIHILNEYKSLSATDKKSIIEGRCSKTIALYTYSERINKALTHSVEGCRSILSELKEELALERFGGAID